MVRLKRVYEEPGRQDWMRVFVDRLWPRSVKGESGAHLSAAQGPVPLRYGGLITIRQFALPVSQRESEVPRRWTADEPYNQTVQTVVSNVLFGELS
jgi:hypothetical protein